MFQILENQVTNYRLFVEDLESGAGSDLKKPGWTWIDFVNSHQVLPPLHVDALIRSLFRFFTVNKLGLCCMGRCIFHSRPASFGNEIGCLRTAVCLWPASPSGLRLPLHAGSSSVPMDTVNIADTVVFGSI